MSATARALKTPRPLGDAPPARSGRSRGPSFTALKTTMAVTGTIMAAFVTVHMVGNLKAFMGAQAYNSYAAWLREVAYPLLPHEGLLWILRVVLLACIGLHTAAGVELWRRGRASRGRFRRRGLPARTTAARSMLLTGCLIAVFVVVHILDLTIGRLVASPSYTAPSHSDGALHVSAYQNLVASLSRPGMAIFYSAIMLAIALHLAQGLWNVVVDLGGTGERLRRIWLAVALAVAAAVALGNGALPLLILAGVIS